MLSHDNVSPQAKTLLPCTVCLSCISLLLVILLQLTWMTRRVMSYVKWTTGDEHVVSYLPLSHIAPQLLDVYCTMASAG